MDRRSRRRRSRLIPTVPVLRRPGGHELLVLLHGYGDHPEGLFGFAELFDPSHRFTIVAPSGPVETTTGPAWFGVGHEGADGRSLLDALDGLDTLLAGESARLGIEPSAAVVLGYSQGGAVALALALRRRALRRYRAVGALASHLVDADGLEWALSDAADQTDVLLVHGVDDETVPIQLGRGAARALERAGVAVTWHEIDTAHALGPALLGPVPAWLSRRPPVPPPSRA